MNTTVCGNFTIDPPQPTYSNSDSHTHTTNQAPKLQSRIPILHYDNDWVCVNKPAGITVHRSHRTPKHQAVLTSRIKRQLGRKVYPVHRLDHRTSGAMVLSFVNGTLCGQLHSGLGHKQCIALVRGLWNTNQRTILVNTPVKVHGVAKEAQTKFTLLATTTTSKNDTKADSIMDDYDHCSVVLCEPLTGRTHQIRRHAYAIGHPIIGDTQHGDTKVNRYWRNHYGMDRLGLHCISLAVSVPLDHQRDKDNQLDTVESESTDNLETIKGVTVNPNGTTTTRTITAPLSPEFQRVLRHYDGGSLWRTVIQQDPRLQLERIDVRGGTHGRNYCRRNLSATKRKHQ